MLICCFSERACLGWSGDDQGFRMLGLGGDLSSSPVALEPTDHFRHSHLATIGSVWMCSVVSGTQRGSRNRGSHFRWWTEIRDRCWMKLHGKENLQSGSKDRKPCDTAAGLPLNPLTCSHMHHIKTLQQLQVNSNPIMPPASLSHNHLLPSRQGYSLMTLSVEHLPTDERRYRILNIFCMFGMYPAKLRDGFGAVQ